MKYAATEMNARPAEERCTNGLPFRAKEKIQIELNELNELAGTSMHQVGQHLIDGIISIPAVPQKITRAAETLTVDDTVALTGSPHPLTCRATETRRGGEN